MTRAELYALVWADPMVHVAKRFGLSDVGLRKICKKHDIPTPPLGYWAKLAHGKKVRRPLLPALKEGIPGDIDLAPRPVEIVPDAVQAARQAAAKREADLDNETLSLREQPPHRLTVATEKALRKVKSDYDGFIACSGPGLVSVRIGPNSLDRAVHLIDVLIKGVLARGNQLTPIAEETRMVADGEFIAFRVYEGVDRKEYVPTKEEVEYDKKRKAEREEWRKRFPALYPQPASDTKSYRTWEKYPSGRLCLEITDPSLNQWEQQYALGRWYDRASKHLEDYVSDIMIAVAAGAARIKHRRAEEAEKARIAAEEAERRRREKVRLEREQRRLKFISERANDYANYTRIMAFATALERQAQDGGITPVDSLAELSRDVVGRLERQFTRDALNAEIEKLGLYPNDDESSG